MPGADEPIFLFRTTNMGDDGQQEGDVPILRSYMKRVVWLVEYVNSTEKDVGEQLL